MHRSLWVVCTQEFFPKRLKIRDPHTREQYRYAVNNLSEFLGREATLADLSDDNITAMMSMLLERGLAARTVNERRGRINTIWTWCCKRGMLSTWPTVERIPEPNRIPRAWTSEQLESLFIACRREPRNIGGIRGDLWWVALHAVLWNTGERIGAVLAIRWEWLDQTARVLEIPAVVRKGKSRDMVYRLWPETVQAIRQIAEPIRELVFPWPYHQGTFYNWYDRLLRRAGLPHDRRCKPHKMRISHASWMKAYGGNATAALGHADPGTTQRYYEDPVVAAPEPPRLFVPW